MRALLVFVFHYFVCVFPLLTPLTQLTLAEVAALVAITELAGLIDAGGRARGHNSTEGANIGREIVLDGGVAARIEHLARNDRLDRGASTTEAEGLLAEEGAGASGGRALVREHGARRGEAGLLWQEMRAGGR